LELEPARFDRALGERPEHERVVGIGAMTEPDQHRRGRLAAPSRGGAAYRRACPKNQRSSGFVSSSRRNGRTLPVCPSCSETLASSSSASLAAASASPIS